MYEGFNPARTEDVHDWGDHLTVAILDGPTLIITDEADINMVLAIWTEYEEGAS